MAIGGQGCLCAARLGAACLMCVAGPVLGQEREERSLEVRVSGTAVHDSNAARSSKAQAAARGLVQEEMEFRPTVNASVVLPFNQHAFFADSQVGYEFHSHNKQLESERITATGGVRLRRGRCMLEASGHYARRRSDLADDFSDAPANVEQVHGADAALRCRRPVGLSPVASVSFRQSRNGQESRRRSDLDSVTVTGGIAYEQPSVGRLSLEVALSDQTYPHRTMAGGREDGIRTVAARIRLDRGTGSLLKGSLSAGYIQVDPKLPGVKGFEGTVYGAELRLTPGGRAAFALSAARMVEASNRLDVSYYRQDQIDLSIHNVIGPRLNTDLRGSWRRRRFALSPILSDIAPPASDRQYEVGAGLRYRLNWRIELGADLEYQRRDAAAEIFDYNSLRAGLTATYRI